MKQSKKIALCGISAAIGALFLFLYKFAPTGKLSLFALSSVAIMIPLCKKLYGGAVLTMIATAAIGFISGGVTVLVPYLLIFGIHPIINVFLDKTGIKGKAGYIIKLLIKLVYINAVLFVIYKLAILAALITVAIDYYIFAIILSLIFIPYDYLMQIVQKRIGFLMTKYLKF